MHNSLKQDSTKTFKPIIYQFYIALEKCFDLRKDEKLFIETYGDVTVSNDIQIEVKDYDSELTDLDHNIWNTLKNWIDLNFNISYYKKLILLTTQNLSINTQFINWNSKNKDEKYNILKEIAETYSKRKKKSEKTEKLIKIVLDDTNINKLKDILEKFIIDSSYKNDEELYFQLIETRTSGIPEDNKDIYLDGLLGSIINPLVTSLGWEITYEKFRTTEKRLIEQYNSKSIIFPSKISAVKVGENEQNNHNEKIYITKIEEIKYDDVKSEAISDYIKRNLIVSKELIKRSIDKEHFDNYEDEIKKLYKPLYRRYSRKTNKKSCINDSQDFYDEMMEKESPNFFNFSNTPRYFKNGTLHNLADDSSENIIWKLKVKEDE